MEEERKEGIEEGLWSLHSPLPSIIVHDELLIELGVAAVGLEEVPVGAALDDPALVDEEDEALSPQDHGGISRLNSPETWNGTARPARFCRRFSSRFPPAPTILN